MFIFKKIFAVERTQKITFQPSRPKFTIRYIFHLGWTKFQARSNFRPVILIHFRPYIFHHFHHNRILYTQYTYTYTQFLISWGYFTAETGQESEPDYGESIPVCILISLAGSWPRKKWNRLVALSPPTNRNSPLFSSILPTKIQK